MKPLVVLFLLCVPASGWAQVWYSIVNLEALGAPASERSGARSLNNAGEVAGTYWTPGQGELRVFTYTDGRGMRDLGVSLGGLTHATGVNDSGQIAVFGTPWGGDNAVYRHSPGQGLVSLGGLGGQESETYGINNQGQVTGFSELPNGTVHAFRYTDGVGMQDLGSLYGGNSVGRAINNLGWVTGNSDGWNVFLYRDGASMSYLGQGIGWAVNDQGAVAGATLVTASGGQAFFYLNGEMSLLGSLGAGSSEARGINEHNEVVGWGYAPAPGGGRMSHAFVWNRANGMVDLNSVVPADSGWVLTEALDINDFGQIVGVGNYNGRITAFRLDPIPEPVTWALLVWGGLVLLGRRQRRGS